MKPSIPLWILCLCAVLLAHPAIDAYRLREQSRSVQAAPYKVTQRRFTDRVVLIVIDSWAARILESPDWMPKLFHRKEQGASGVLWAPMATNTLQGVLTLSIGAPAGGLAGIGLVASARYEGWTIYDDIVSRNERVLFSGGPAWVALFGNRGSNNFRETGHGPKYREDDLGGLLHLRQALLSSNPPTLSVLQISETDFAGHQTGTVGTQYASVMRYWDDTLDQFLSDVLKPGTTIIVTSDHGNDMSGSHGASGDIYRRVPLVMLGQAIVPHKKVEISAADIPSTVAVLLGIRAPGNVVSIPAVEAIEMSPHERDQIARVAFGSTVLGSSRAVSDTSLRDALRHAVDRTAPTNPTNALAAVKIGTADETQIVRSVTRRFAAELGPSRPSSVLDWAFAAISFGCLVVLALKHIGLTRRKRRLSTRAVVMWLVPLVAIETAFCLRMTMSGEIKTWMKSLHPSGILTISIVSLGIAVFIYLRMRKRFKLFYQAGHQQIASLVLVYIALVALHPVTTAGLLGIFAIAAFIYSSSWSKQTGLIVGAAFFFYFAIGSLFLWPMLGENLTNRFVVGGVFGTLAVAFLMLLERISLGSIEPARYLGLLCVALVLAVFPAGGLGMVGWNSGNFAPVVFIQLAIFCVAISLIKLPPLLAWLAPISLVAFWLKPGNFEFNAAFIACSLLPTIHLPRIRASLSHRVSVLLSLTCLLLLLSTPSKGITLILLLGATVAFIAWKPTGSQKAVAIVLAALFLIGSRYMIFDLFGNTDDLFLFTLNNIDVRSAYVGNAMRPIVPAILMALLKIWVTGTILIVALLTFQHWHAMRRRVLTVAAMFLMVNVAQSSLYAAMCFGDRTYLYEMASFSVFTNTCIFVFGVLSILVVNCLTGPMRSVRRSETRSGSSGLSVGGN
jgi:Metalloenzyme superfamily